MKAKQIMAMIMAIVMMTGILSAQVCADDNSTPDIFNTISRGIGSSATYLDNQLKSLAESDGITYGFEWYVVAMLRAGKPLDSDALNQYYSSLESGISQWTDETKPTDKERVVLALSAMDKDLTDIGGSDVAQMIYNDPKLANGANELAYALLALDAGDIRIPDDGIWNRSKIIDSLLQFQLSDGSFGLYDTKTGDVDMTAICMQALAPYCNDDKVMSAVENALEFLRLSIPEGYVYAGNPNTTASVLLALSSLTIDVTDPSNGFGDNEFNIITALESFRNPEGNGYTYEGKVNSMATVQILQAYDAYRKAHLDGVSYWNFNEPGNTYDDLSKPDDSENETEQTDSAIIHITIVSDGMVVTDKNGEYVAQADITVNDTDEDGILTVDEALFAAHEALFDGGAAAGYASYNSPYGPSIATLWGNGDIQNPTSAGYWLNNASCMSLTDEVKEGDFLTAFNYMDTASWSDSYSYFTDNTVTAYTKDIINLELMYQSGYDENWMPAFSPCSDAKIIILGNDSEDYDEIRTNSEGKAEISFESEGVYTVAAYAEDGSIVPSVCRITISEKKAKDAKVYVTIASDGEIVVAKDGNHVAHSSVTVSDINCDGKLTIDEALFATHEAMFEGGAAAGYASYNGSYGLSLATLWGKGSIQEPAVAGYWLNNASCMNLADEVKDGDLLTAFNYFDTVNWGDSYSYFTQSEITAYENDSINLELMYQSGYDENWMPAFSPRSDAAIMILGDDSGDYDEIRTNSEGKAEISFGSKGDYFIVAYTDDKSIVPCVCKITVKKSGGSDSGSGSGSGSSDNITVYIRVADPNGKTYFAKKSFTVKKDTTAYELLLKTGLDIEVSKDGYGVYVESVEGLGEFDEGAESGWMYRINKKIHPAPHIGGYPFGQGLP